MEIDKYGQKLNCECGKVANENAFTICPVKVNQFPKLHVHVSKVKMKIVYKVN